jgi:RimJ/RimL family protein N-acetyltransferase
VRLTDGVVVLRDWEERDVEPAARACADPEIPRWTRVPEDNTPELIRAFLASPVAEVRLIVADARTDELLGSIGLLREVPEDRRAELGYWIAAEHRGRGIAVRAVNLLADWAFAEHGLARLELHVDPANTASIRVAEKTGFAFEGVLRSYEEIKGVRHDVAMHARLASAPHG